jgi:preprotein translocase subunit Sss1
MATILYFIPFLYMYAAVIRLADRPDRKANKQAVLIPGGRAGVWIAGVLGFVVTLGSMALAAIPPDTADTPARRVAFEANIAVWTMVMIGIGLVLYYAGARKKA